MLKASIEIEVTTSINNHPDPYNFWTVRLISKNGDGNILQILEQDFQKSDFRKTDAANQMLEDTAAYRDLIFGDY